MGQSVPFGIGAGTQFDVGQAITEVDGNAVAFGRLNVGGFAGHFGGFVEDLPTEVFKLPTGNDGSSTGHVGSLMEDTNNGATVSLHSGATVGEREVLHSVIAKTIEVNRAATVALVFHVITGNGTVGSPIEQGELALRELAGIDTDDVSCTRARAMVSEG